MLTQIRCAPAVTLLALGGLTLSVHGVGSDLPDSSDCSNINMQGGLPFTDSGDTSALDCNGAEINDDFQPDCDQGPDVAPDVFYSYTAPPAGINIYIETCGSIHDTKIYVLDDSFQLVACNDDACDDAQGDPFASRIDCVQLAGDATYFIAVDGFFNTSGEYDLTVREATEEECAGPVCPECPPDGTPEDESCGFGTMGKLNENGGCDVDPPAFTPIVCGETICGATYFDNNNFRDTDWFQIDSSGDADARSYRLVAHGESPLQVGLIAMQSGFEGSGDCAAALGVSPFVVSEEECEQIEVTTDPLVPGVHWFFVAHSFFGDVVICEDAEYTFTVDCGEAPTCPEDIDGDGDVGFTDLLSVLAAWGPCKK